MSMALPSVRPISDFRTDLNGICEEARRTQQPIIMTKNGKASLVVMDSQAYEAQRQHDRYVAALREAEIEARYQPEALSQQALDERIGTVLAALEKR